MILRRSTLAALLLAGSVAACTADLDGPRSIREVVGHVVSPHGPEGAVVLDIRGRGLETVEAIEADSAQVFVQRAGNHLRVILIREVPGEMRFRLRLVDRQAIVDARVVAAAGGGGGNEPRNGLNTYTVAWVR